MADEKDENLSDQNVSPKPTEIQRNVYSTAWQERRAKIRSTSKISEKIRVSMQKLELQDVNQKLEGLLNVSTAVSKRAIYAGLLYVLHELTSTDQISGKLKGILPFQEGYELYSSAFGPEILTPDPRNFRDNLLSDDIGLPVVVFMVKNVNYVALDPGCNVVRFLDLFINYEAEELETRFDLDAISLKTIIDSMESEYDRSVVRAIIATMCTRSEIYNLGIKPQVAVASLQRILTVSSDVQNALTAGTDMAVLSLQEKISKKEREIEYLKESYDALRKMRSDSRHLDSISEKITTCNESLTSLQQVLNHSDSYSRQKFNAAARKKSQNLIEQNRLRNRASGAGAKRKLDDIDEELIAKAIEQKTTAHGRRHDMVLYYHKRLKRDDLLSIANYHLLERGKEMIKSATTVYNRGKTKKQRSLQSKNHIGNLTK